MAKNLPVMWETWFDPWVGKIPWRRAWQPSPVFLPGEFHGQRSLAGYSLWGYKESDTTERLSTYSTPPKSRGLRYLVTLEQCHNFLISSFFLRDFTDK